MSKRNHGEGSIYQMADGRWRAAVTTGWKVNTEGKPVQDRKVFTAETRGEVQDELVKALHNQSRGLPVNASKQRLDEFLGEWLESTVKPNVRPKTYRSYEQMVRNHLSKNIPPELWKETELDSVPGLGAAPLSKLSLQRVQRFLAEKLKAGNSPSLVRYLRVVLRIALNEAVKDDRIPRNPAALATPPKVESRPIMPFTPEQAVRFLQAAQGHRLESLFTVVLAVGLRSGEASGLRWPDLDLENGLLAVERALQRQKGEGLVEVPIKGKKPRRVVNLPEVCIRSLRAHQKRQELERQWAGTAWHDTGYVFTSTIGTPLDDRKILKEFTALVEAAKLPKQRFHDLRHACVSLLHAQGVPDKEIAEIVGHSDIRLTQAVYQHVFDAGKRDAADKMNELLEKVATPNPVATKIATKPAPALVN